VSDRKLVIVEKGDRKSLEILHRCNGSRLRSAMTGSIFCWIGTFG